MFWKKKLKQALPDGAVPVAKACKRIESLTDLQKSVLQEQMTVHGKVFNVSNVFDGAKPFVIVYMAEGIDLLACHTYDTVGALNINKDDMITIKGKISKGHSIPTLDECKIQNDTLKVVK